MNASIILFLGLCISAATSIYMFDPYDFGTTAMVIGGLALGFAAFAVVLNAIVSRHMSRYRASY